MKDLNFKRIAHKLRETRLAKGLTQEYIANMADVNTSHISNIENNRVKISLSTLVQVCNALGVTVDYILSDEYLSPSLGLEQEILRELQDCSPQVKGKVLKIIQVLK